MGLGGRRSGFKDTHLLMKNPHPCGEAPLNVTPPHLTLSAGTTLSQAATEYTTWGGSWNVQTPVSVESDQLESPTLITPYHTTVKTSLIMTG
jgi:hypothetical protein